MDDMFVDSLTQIHSVHNLVGGCPLQQEGERVHGDGRHVCGQSRGVGGQGGALLVQDSQLQRVAQQVHGKIFGDLPVFCSARTQTPPPKKNKFGCVFFYFWSLSGFLILQG